MILAQMVQTWCKQTKIDDQNFNKMYFATKPKIKSVPYLRTKLDNVAFERVATYKYLGIILDSSLSLPKQVVNLTRIIGHKSYLLLKMRQDLPEWARITLTKTMIMPYIDYGDIIYSAASDSEKQLNKIQRIHTRCLKTCMASNPPPNMLDAHIKSSMNLLKDRRRNHLLNMVYTRSFIDKYINKRGIHSRAHDVVLYYTQTQSIKI